MYLGLAAAPAAWYNELYQIVCKMEEEAVLNRESR